jgi:hypothetical protein
MGVFSCVATRSVTLGDGARIDGANMRYSNLQNPALISLLVAVVAQGTAACSSGSDNPTKPSTTTMGMGGASGSSTSGSAGSSTTNPTSTTTNPTTTVGTGGAGGGTGGSGGSGGSGAPSVCDGKGTRLLGPGDGVIDNFEGAMISPGWASFNDVMPTPNSFQIKQEAGGALGTGHYGHYAGMGAKTPLMGGYGVGTIYNEAIDTHAGIYCVDITGFDGVTFWAKSATSGKVGVNFILPETNMVATNPDLGGGDCTIGCYSHPYKTVTLTPTWQQYSVTFAEAGMGTAKVSTRIQMLGWLSPDANWDFSLDEIQLYKGTPPTGPVTKADAGP